MLGGGASERHCIFEAAGGEQGNTSYEAREAGEPHPARHGGDVNDDDYFFVVVDVVHIGVLLVWLL